jgi:hypothetical protein
LAERALEHELGWYAVQEIDELISGAEGPPAP